MNIIQNYFKKKNSENLEIIEFKKEVKRNIIAHKWVSKILNKYSKAVFKGKTKANLIIHEGEYGELLISFINQLLENYNLSTSYAGRYCIGSRCIIMTISFKDD